MDLQQIKALIDALTASDLSELEYQHDGSTLRLVKNPAPADLRAPGLQAPPVSAQPAPLTGVVAAPAATAAPVAPAEICSPVYGVVHLRPSPAEPPFVAVGEAVAAGRTLCVIEAMKVFNEVRAERAATVATVLVESGQEVESGQPLFRLTEAGGGAAKENHV
ncbi:acetyl-CoA carboxylase biotin carboxyl carrier protein [Rhodoferax ferrireducens]|uniref:acetyl-CoA carboxylase biotin carboxyl carrier protein n=1 Tax=Rhodoferax ferrireducens TaxID=192843 RepID=UPI000E0DD911|nr:biotin/lipoyl-containing protein [Rhodoferax ferrireducens]